VSITVFDGRFVGPLQPSEVEEGAVVYRAWELADNTEEVLHWGDEREYRRGDVR
jgi:hypothetical protein